jgi:uncharacterized membrane protein
MSHHMGVLMGFLVRENFHLLLLSSLVVKEKRSERFSIILKVIEVFLWVEIKMTFKVPKRLVSTLKATERP